MSGHCPTCGAPLTRQFDLFEPVPAAVKTRRDDPVPSRVAARLAAPRQGSGRFTVLEALDAGPGTAEDLAVRTRMPYVTVSTRLSELKRGGFAEPVGHRKTATKATADLLAITPKGRAAVAEVRREAVAA